MYRLQFKKSGRCLVSICLVVLSIMFSCEKASSKPINPDNEPHQSESSASSTSKATSDMIADDPFVQEAQTQDSLLDDEDLSTNNNPEQFDSKITSTTTTTTTPNSRLSIDQERQLDHLLGSIKDEFLRTKVDSRNCAELEHVLSGLKEVIELRLEKLDEAKSATTAADAANTDYDANAAVDAGSCQICHKNFERHKIDCVTLPVCKDEFHQECIEKYLEFKGFFFRCPTCRMITPRNYRYLNMTNDDLDREYPGLANLTGRSFKDKLILD